MHYDCGLFFYGLVDHDGLRELLSTLDEAGFGLLHNPFRFYADGHSSAAYTRQSGPDLDPAVRACLSRLGLFALWEKTTTIGGMADGTNKSLGYELCHPGYHKTIVCDEIPDGHLKLADPQAPEAERKILSAWPRLTDFFEDNKKIRLTVVTSRHEAIAKAKDPSLLPGVFAAYRNPQGVRAG